MPYQLAGSPCVADRPARSCPWAGPQDCTLLLGSLKDQEENLIVVKTWTRRGEKEEKTHQTISNCPSPNIHCKTLCYSMRMAPKHPGHANRHPVCKQSRTHTISVSLSVTHTHTLMLTLQNREDALSSTVEKKACSLTGSVTQPRLSPTNHHPYRQISS